MKKQLIIGITVLLFAIYCSFSFSVYADIIPESPSDTSSSESEVHETTTDISTALVELQNTTFTYTGNECMPEEKVTLDGKLLEKNTDYTVAYNDNINAGKASLTITGTGNYTGEITCDYTILPLNITDNGFTFTNNIKKLKTNEAPDFTVTYNGNKLNNTDYVLSIKNNTTPGIKSATVTITGKGNYTGTKTFDISIYPDKVSSVYANRSTVKTFKLNWKSQQNVTGYKVYLTDKNGKKTKLYKTVTKNSCVVTKRKPGKTYYFKIRAYVTKGNTTIFGDFSVPYEAGTKPDKVEIGTVTKAKNKKGLKVGWKKVACTSYEIQYSQNKKFKKNVKSVFVSANKTNKTIKIKRSNKTYYARVRAIVKCNNNTVVYGPWSYSLSTSYTKLYSTYSTYYVSNAARTNNLRIASKKINGTIVKPGQTFSFNKTVGKRTAGKGYRAAHVFTGPNTMTMGIGGGVCQVASTMFNATLLGNLKIVERHQHSQRVTYCPLGRDAAIYWGAEDFKFKNNTNYPIMIKMSVKNGKISCSYYVCYDVKPKKVKLSVSRSGNHFTLKRKAGGKVNYTTHSTY